MGERELPTKFGLDPCSRRYEGSCNMYTGYLLRCSASGDLGDLQCTRLKWPKTQNWLNVESETE